MTKVQSTLKTWPYQGIAIPTLYKRGIFGANVSGEPSHPLAKTLLRGSVLSEPGCKLVPEARRPRSHETSFTSQCQGFGRQAQSTPQVVALSLATCREVEGYPDLSGAMCPPHLNPPRKFTGAPKENPGTWPIKHGKKGKNGEKGKK